MDEEIIDRSSRHAAALGMSRSEPFDRTACRLDGSDAESLTDRIDAAVERLGVPDEATAWAVTAGHRVLDALDEKW